MPPTWSTTSRFIAPKYPTNLARLWPPSASTISLNHRFWVHVQSCSVMVPKCISEFAWSIPPCGSQNLLDQWKLGKSAWDQEPEKIESVIRIMRWCLSNRESIRYVLSFTASRTITTASLYASSQSPISQTLRLPPLASPHQLEWWWWWGTDYPATTASKGISMFP